VATLRAKLLPMGAGVLLILSSPILGLSPMMPYLARAIGSAGFGIAFLWFGWTLLMEKPAAAKA
jgi:hypothetical protein